MKLSHYLKLYELTDDLERARREVDECRRRHAQTRRDLESALEDVIRVLDRLEAAALGVGEDGEQ